MATTPMLSPDGQTGDIPVAKLQDALAAGFKVAAAMQSPDGSIGYIPQERVADALKAGFVPHTVAPVPLPEGEQGMDARAYVAEHPIATVLKGNPNIPVNAPGVLSPGEGAGLPLKVAAYTMGAMAPGSEVYDAAKQLLDPEVHIGQAKQLFSAVENAVGDNPVNLTDAMKDTLDEIKEGSKLGGGGGSIANNLMDRLTNAENAPLSYKEARTLYSNLGRLTSADQQASNPNTLRLLNQFRSQLGDAIENTTSQSGKLADYQQAMKSFGRGKQLESQWEAAKDVVSKYLGNAAKTGAAGAGVGAGYELGKSLKEIFWP